MSQPSVPLIGESLKAALLSSPRAKLARADAHLDALYRETDGWGDGDPFAITRESNADGSEHLFSLRYKVQPDVWHWAVLLGDALFNLRCALDHTVYALAIAQTRKDPPDDEGKLAFPICSKDELFEKQRWRIASLTQATQTAIEKAQPYNRLKPGKVFAPLLWLEELNNIDKHRLAHLTPVAIRPNEGLSTSAPAGGFQALWNNAALVDGAPILKLLLTKPDPNVYVDLKGTGSVVLDAEGWPPVSLHLTMQRIRREVVVVCRYLAAFFPLEATSRESDTAASPSKG